jgi:hypothetical protein
MDTPRLFAGALVWCLLAWGGWQLAGGGDSAQQTARNRWISDLGQYARGPQRSLELRLPEPQIVAVGDPIFVTQADGGLRRVGEIVALRRDGQPLAVRQTSQPVTSAEAVFYPSAPPLGSGAELQYMTTPDSLAWVTNTLLTPQRKQEIAAELSAAIEAHRGEILAALRPIAEQSLREAAAIVEEDLPLAIQRHRPQLQKIGARYHEELVDQEIAPLVKQEIWPIVRKHGEPVMDEIGGELWRRVSLWRFGWRFAYDQSPLPEKKLLEREWQRFVDDEAMPILQEHTDALMGAIEASLRDTARNSEVRAALRRSLTKVLEDPELQQVVWQIVRESMVDNPRLRESLQRHWTSPEAQAAFRLASDRLEPTVRRIADRIFGTPESGITPEFAQVLRNQILHKDRRWFLLRVDALEPVRSGQPAESLEVRIAPAAS